MLARTIKDGVFMSPRFTSAAFGRKAIATKAEDRPMNRDFCRSNSPAAFSTGYSFLLRRVRAAREKSGPKTLLDVFQKGIARFQPDTILQDDDRFAARGRSKFPDVVQINQARTVDSNEALRREPLLHV